MDVMMTAEQKVGWRVQMKAVMTVVMTVALKAVLKVELKADPMVDSKADQKALRMIELLAMKRGNNESKQRFKIVFLPYLLSAYSKDWMLGLLNEIGWDYLMMDLARELG